MESQVRLLVNAEDVTRRQGIRCVGKTESAVPGCGIAELAGGSDSDGRRTRSNASRIAGNKREDCRASRRYHNVAACDRADSRKNLKGCAGNRTPAKGAAAARSNRGRCCVKHAASSPVAWLQPEETRLVGDGNERHH